MENRNEEKQPAGEIVIRGRFAEWFDNFWYHYKWITIGVLVAAAVLLVCLLQTCSKEEEDIRLVYAGPTVLTSSEMEQITAVMDAVMPYDLNQDGDLHSEWTTYLIYSEEQMKTIAETQGENGSQGYADRGFNTDQYSTYSNYLKTGETSIYFLDPWLYAELRATGHLSPLSDALGEMPRGAVDEYGVRLGDTALYQKYKALSVLPEDTVICLMRQYVVGKSSDDESYRFECDMLRALLTLKNENE